MPRITLGSLEVTEGSEPYVIAEIGVNHEGSLETAKRLIELAREGGAHCAKFQSYKAETLASRHSPAYWDTTKEPAQSQYKLFQRYDSFGPDEYRELAQHCERVGIDFLSTPFDLDAVEFLDPLVETFKIASGDITNLPLLRGVAGRGKPVLLSTGASTLVEIDTAIRELREGGCRDICLLHCILNYPTLAEHAHLSMITGLRRSYPEAVIGYSDHTHPSECMSSLVSAYLLGARVIEKHFTHDKSLPGNDHYHAMDVEDLRRLMARLRKVRVLLGPSDHKAPIPTESPARRYARRSIVLNQGVDEGCILSAGMLTCKRPGTGISPLHWDEVVGRFTTRDLEEDTPLQWEHLSPGQSNP